MDSAPLLNRLRGVPGAARVFRRLTAGYEEGSVVQIARGPASGLRWARYHRYVNAYWMGVYELPLQRALATELRLGDSFWDVGANAGFFSVLAAKLVGSEGHVKAFDPLPANVESIAKQFELNPLTNFEILPFAASDRTGKAMLVLTENTSTPHLASPEGSPAGGTGALEVETVTLDSISGHPPTLVKVDVEGAELDVLKGATRMLETGTRWLIELHEGPQREEVIRLLLRAGYSDSTPPQMRRSHLLAVPR